MNPLRRLQREFQAYILTRGGPIEQAIAATETLNTRARLEIYAEAYRLRLLEALAAEYIGLAAHLGEAAFETLGRAYIERHPSHSPTLRDYGDKLAAFLRTTPPWQDEPLLAELAAFDWALATVFDAPDAPVASVTDLAAVAPERWPTLRLVFHPAVVRLDLEWNAPAIRQAAEDKRPLPAPSRQPYPVGWVLWRQQLRTYFRSLSVEEAFALDAARRGECFAVLCERLCEWLDPLHVPAHAAGLLRRWLEDGLIESVTDR
jgi:hypothetical protein